jgi:RNA polymerase sigma-70 factor, ECF subfamily
LPAQKSDQAEFRSSANEARLRLLMTTHFDFVWRSLRRLGLPEPDADDGAQEVFLVASRKLSQINLGRERQFLFATAVRVASTRRRGTKRRREEPLQNADEEEHSEPGPERLTEMSRARRELQDILDGMDLDQRAPFILFELEELTVPEIASTLGIPIGTVSSRLRAAREHFQASLRRLHAREAFPNTCP